MSVEIKEAIVLAGGFGTRLQGVVKDLPKPMAPVNGRPFLTYILDYLIDYEYQRVVLSVGYLHEKIVDYFGERYKTLEIDYAVETEPLGTGGGILFAMSKCATDNVTISKDNLIALFAEKQVTFGRGYINGGVYLINRKIFEKYPQPKKFSFEKDLMTKYYTQECFYAMPSDGYFIDIGIPEDYARAQREL